MEKKTEPFRERTLMAAVIASSVGIVMVAIVLAVVCKVKQNQKLLSGPRTKPNTTAEMVCTDSGAASIMSQCASDVTYAYPSALHLPMQHQQLPRQAVQSGHYAVTALNVQVLEVHNVQRASSATYHYPYIGSTFPRGIKPPGFPDDLYERYEVEDDEYVSISSMEENDDAVNQETFFVPTTVKRAYGIELCHVV